LLFLILLGLPLPLLSAQEPAPRDGDAPATSAPIAKEIEVTFAGHGGFELGGTLVVPEFRPASGAPALVLLPGSGPTDRNGNQPPLFVTDLLASIAERLADAGIATLRFDKRDAHVHLEHILALDTAAQNEFLSWESFVGDARAGVAFLRGCEGVDPTRVGLFGHSEGGLIALQVAVDLGAGKDGVRTLVLAATPARSMAEILRYQIGRQLAEYPDAIRDPYMRGLDRAMKQVVETGMPPVDLAPGLRALFPANAMKLLQVELALEPTELAPRYAGPVFVLQGQLDVQVEAANATELTRAFASRASGECELFVVPFASHNFKQVADETEPGFEGPVVPAAIHHLADWLNLAS
jgi:hypothetical protein